MSAPPEQLFVDRMTTPLGEAILVVDGEGVLRAFDWATHEARMALLLRRQNPPTQLQSGSAPARLRAALAAYFEGAVTSLEGLAWRTGGTAFQREVWRALCTIPPGQTVCYKDLALRIGRPRAVRAVGLANGANPIGIVVPCHRVIGANGTLTGYGGGLDRKRWLLAHEQAHSDQE